MCKISTKNVVRLVVTRVWVHSVSSALPKQQQVNTRYIQEQKLH